MTDLDYDAIDIYEDETSESHVRIGKSDLDSLRAAAKNSSKSRKEADELKRELAVRDAGLNDLTPKQRNALFAGVENVNAESLRAEAVDLGFIAPPEPVTPPEQTAAELADIDKAAQVANGASAPQSNKLSAGDTSGWSAEKRMRFTNAHPDLAELLMRGETIDAPPGFTA